MTNIDTEIKTIVDQKLFSKSHDYLINHWHEEVGELMQALNKYKRGNSNLSNIHQEIGDVLILTLCLKEIFGAVEVDNEILEKIKKKKLQKL